MVGGFKRSCKFEIRKSGEQKRENFISSKAQKSCQKKALACKDLEISDDIKRETVDLMEENHDSCFPRICDWEKDLQNFSSPSHKKDAFSGVRIGGGGDYGVSVDSPQCLSGSRLVPTGFNQMNFRAGDCVLFVNAGGGAIKGLDSRLNLKGDFCFQGGDIIRTDESIINGGDYPLVYQSARYGDFYYQFDDLLPGDYLVDLHFAEIVNTNGPKGMRVFNVFVQEEKVVSELDIYSVVGANKPLQLVDVRVPIVDNGAMVIRFKAIRGSAVVCGICIRNASKPSTLVKPEYRVCNNCSTKMEVSPTWNRARTAKDIVKYEKKIQELTSQCQLKNDECYEAWMSLAATNDQLEKLKMELDNKFFRAELLDRDMDKQAALLRDVSDRYKHDKKFWVASVNDLEGKIKAMKHEHGQLSKEAHNCADSIPELNKMAFAVQALVAQCEDLKAKYGEELAKRKKLHNQVQEIKGNIRVFCRCRPLSKAEVTSGCATIVDFNAAKDGELGLLTGGSSKKTFKFDRVYTPKDNQVDVFADASPMVVSVLDGYNVCIFAYGQTGTGKTFTMEGNEHNRGVNYRTLEELFKFSKERQETFAYNISVSVLEVYNEQIRDLLATSPSSKKLEIRQAAEGSHHVPGIVEAKVNNIKEVWDVLQAGSNARAVGSNNVNEHSSRSHCMLCIMVKSKNLMNGECTKSKLWLVDLAGSERLAKTDAQGERLKEAQNINRSLSALGDVISALASKSSHIPYRNSKLTHLLQDSLGGDSKTLMFVQISPSDNDLGETLSSLNFAARVRGVELGPAKKQIDTGELQKMKLMLDKARQELRCKDESLRNLEENRQTIENKLRSNDQIIRNQQDKVKELEGQIQSKTESLQTQSERQLWQLSEKLKGREEMCMALEQKVEELEIRLKEQQRAASMALQLKVEELENELKERQQHSKSSVLEQKVKELNNKLREQERQSESMILDSADKSRATPNEGKGLSESTSNKSNLNILRSSNSFNRMNQGPITLSGPNSDHQIRRKRERRSGAVGKSENNDMSYTSSFIEKDLPSELKRLRHIDSTKAMGRITKTSKAAAPTTTTQKLFSRNKINRQHQVGGIKEREKTRGWLR
ncbi:kinesin-like protein KIN-14E isoform X2 [Magnolia sinica]|uniref:kinesin-like protein KIN-14E isoform X2 n=1 Tax=Magnolia sinica TaxID=86752 RepID=UPI0026595900|nr:kinesin-like protein KIN-14E isoform X2 [Magnolia sinica]